MKTKVVVAIDLPDVLLAEVMARRLHSAHPGTWFKIGGHLIPRGGYALAGALADEGMPVFLDAKLYDIPSTCTAALRGIAELGVKMVTVHIDALYGGWLPKAELPDSMTVVAVDGLTSRAPSDTLSNLLQRAARRGARGVVCGSEALGDGTRGYREGMAIVVPGARLAGGDANDHRQTITPFRAVQAGATHIVVGRPIIEADDPVGVLGRIIADVHRAEVAG